MDGHPIVLGFLEGDNETEATKEATGAHDVLLDRSSVPSPLLSGFDVDDDWEQSALNVISGSVNKSIDALESSYRSDDDYF